MKDGTATVVFSGEYRRIKNITTGTVGGVALRQLDATAFQFPAVQRIVYTIEGSAEAWCDFHQTVCTPRERG